jgi:hypothetical protein
LWPASVACAWNARERKRRWGPMTPIFTHDSTIPPRQSPSQWYPKYIRPKDVYLRSGRRIPKGQVKYTANFRTVSWKKKEKQRNCWGLTWSDVDDRKKALQGTISACIRGTEQLPAPSKRCRNEAGVVAAGRAREGGGVLLSTVRYLQYWPSNHHSNR